MPRLGMGMPIISETSEAAVLAVEDFVFLNDVSGELTPVDTSSRTNKLLQSQTFKTTWDESNQATIPNDLFEAPDNSLTAQAITADTAGASNVYIQQTAAVTLGETYTFSIHLKKGAQNFGRMRVVVGSTVHTIICNLTTGAITNSGNVPSVNRHFDKMDDDWIRFGLTFQASATTSSAGFRVYTLGSTASAAATSAAFDAGTELMYLWGAQLEEDSRLTAYIVTTNAAVNVATTELGDLSNVWDFDGTDIMLEVDPENEGAFEEATANLVVNHDFAADSNWTKGTGWTISGGKASNDGSFGSGNSFLISSESDLSVGSAYEVTFTISNYVEGNVRVRAGQAGGTFRTANGTYTEIQTATQTETVRFQGTSSFTGSIDNVFVKEYAITPLNV